MNFQSYFRCFFKTKLFFFLALFTLQMPTKINKILSERNDIERYSTYIPKERKTNEKKLFCRKKASP